MDHDNGVFGSSALDVADLDMVIEEDDFVLISGKPDEAWDDASYDLCDISSALSCATSVATDLTLRDLNVIEDAPATTTDTDEPSSKDRADTALMFLANPKNGLRLSKKKQRKLRRKIKMTRKAKAAAEELASQRLDAAAAFATPRSPPHSPRKVSSPKRKAAANVAIACAREALAAHRDEIEAGKTQKKTRPVAHVE